MHSPVDTATVVAPLTCGIAMCTCNGGAFLRVQLESLVNQSRQPLQVVISDDASDDGSWEVIEQWAREVRASTSIEVLVLRNEPRLGVRRNFQQAIEQLRTDVIFLADQDDVWSASKIEVIACRMEALPDVLLVHTDADLIDEQGRDLGKSLFEALCISKLEQDLIAEARFFEVYCRRNLVTGTTAAFRRELLALALPIPEDWIHDEWLAACAAASKTVAMLPDRLTQYRQHGTNAIGVPTNLFARLVHYGRRVRKTPHDEHLRYKRRRIGALRERLAGCVGVEPCKLSLLDEAVSHFDRRIAFPHGLPGRVAGILREFRMHGYHRFADGYGGVLRDLVRL
ncbi:glycosyltransferase family 2 protein [Cupriavidus sp. P-10]|uniref:glycosyltransferase family 2 protein n=1 Tax=Cupriavidus sp. P-10 TaxID=2027911 RepID=UPI00232CC64B|nr:glycosyltransferase family 2 protein [Cupriavidus sp. P-10]